MSFSPASIVGLLSSTATSGASSSSSPSTQPSLLIRFEHQIEVLIGIREDGEHSYESSLQNIVERQSHPQTCLPANEVAESRDDDDFKETSIAAGKTYEVVLNVDSVNSYIAWDFALEQGKLNMDIGFSMEYLNGSGERTLILPYRRCASDQGNFCTVMAGNYKLIWDNSYSSFFKKALRFKVDCIPPVAEPLQE